MKIQYICFIPKCKIWNWKCIIFVLYRYVKFERRYMYLFYFSVKYEGTVFVFYSYVHIDEGPIKLFRFYVRYI
jgi:hypothetical protein